MKKSFLALLISFTILILAFFSYPKWQQEQAEATIGWDVSGYYLYLPAIFIYGDAKELKFFPTILDKYQPTPDFQQAFMHRSGHYVMKYSCGQAVMYSPFFFIAHGIASVTDYEADGFSRPYQLLISLGSLLVAFIGLFFLRKILLEYFSDSVTAVVLLLMVLGTNYLEYTAISGAMTHNYLFTIYAVLIWQTISFYKKPDSRTAVFIGLLVGLAALTRPVEIISFMIPVLWGIKNPVWESIKERIIFFKTHFPKLFLAVFVTLLVGSLQVIYWKYAGQEWIIYSYEDQGFSWFHPHLIDGFFSYKSGWLVYTPIMGFALLGFVFLWFKKKPVFYAAFLFFGLFIYITFAWDVWWYGGSLGQRAMVQAYPVLAFPLAALLESLRDKKILKFLFVLTVLPMLYFNIWLTYQAHGGGMLRVGQMTKAYFWKTAGRLKMPEHALKLLDTDEEFTGLRKNIQLLYETDFEQDTIIGKCEIPPIGGNNSLCLNKDYQNSPVFYVNKPEGNAKWVRASADFKIQIKEWDFWRMAQFTVRFYKSDKVVKERFIRVYRNMYDGQTVEQFIDVKIPDETYDRIGIQFLNAGGEKPILIDNLRVEAFN